MQGLVACAARRPPASASESDAAGAKKEVVREEEAAAVLLDPRVTVSQGPTVTSPIGITVASFLLACCEDADCPSLDCE